ncbi:hypothetical protein GZL_06447 [Streptomyces sp. 769]|nr:hypothetical protein GZL_06447 [Streptomyces sp. 769]
MQAEAGKALIGVRPWRVAGRHLSGPPAQACAVLSWAAGLGLVKDSTG